MVWVSLVDLPVARDVDLWWSGTWCWFRAGHDDFTAFLVVGLDELRRGTGASAVWVELDQHGVISSPIELPAPPAGVSEIELHHRGALIGWLRQAPAGR